MKNCSAWSRADAVDMGRWVLTNFSRRVANFRRGGMMTKPACIPMPYWGYYFNVAGLDAAVSRAQAGGGKLLNGRWKSPVRCGVATLHGPAGRGLLAGGDDALSLAFARAPNLLYKAAHDAFSQILHRPG